MTFPYHTPEPESLPRYPSSGGQPYRQRRRGLTLWLVVAVIFAILGILAWVVVLAPARDRLGNPLVSPTEVLIFLALLVCNLISIVAIWRWKRWGVIGFVVINIASLIIETLSGLVVPTDFVVPILQMVILYALVKDTWDTNFT